MQAKLNKRPLREGPDTFLLWEAAFPPQADHVLVDLFSSAAAVGESPNSRADGVSIFR